MRAFIIAATLALTGSLSAQTASYTLFGKEPIKLQNIGVPKIGKTFQLTTQGPLRGPRILLFGASRNWWGPIKLPTPLSFHPRGNGFLLVSPDVLILPSLTGPILISIPNAPSLAGLHFYNQVLSDWLELCCPMNCLPCTYFVGSNGGHGVIGT